MVFAKRLGIQLSIVVASLLTVAVLAGGVTFLALAVARQLTRVSPWWLAILAGLVLLIPIICCLPLLISVALLGVAGGGLATWLPLKWAFIVAVLVLWPAYNLISRLSSRWAMPSARSRRKLPRIWQASVYWSTSILAYVCPIVAVGLLGEQAFRWFFNVLPL